MAKNRNINDDAGPQFLSRIVKGEVSFDNCNGNTTTKGYKVNSPSIDTPPPASMQYHTPFYGVSRKGK